MSTPRSPWMPGSLGLPLLVPRKIFPSATTGFPYDVEPICAFHLMFLPLLTSQDSGRPVMAEAMLRCVAPPNIGQSCEISGKDATPVSTSNVEAILTFIRRACHHFAFTS